MKVLDKQKYKYPYIHKFELNGKHYALDYVNLVFAELDEMFNECFDVIAGISSYENILEKYGSEECEEIFENIEQMADQEVFFKKNAQEFSLPSNYEVGLISLPPVHNCNLRCSYCFADHGNVYKDEEKAFSYETLEKALNFIYKDYLKDCSRYRIDFVSGGEPLLNFDIVKKVKEIGDKLYKETNKPLEIWICTNGTKFKPEILDYMDKNRVNIGISLDGDRESHDKMRKDFQGKGTYDNIVNAINEIRHSDKYSRKLKDIWGLVVITGETQSIKDILIHHRKIGLKNVQMKIVRLPKNADFSINNQNLDKIKGLYSELYEFFNLELENNSVEYVKMILNDNDFAGKIIRRLIMRYIVINRCQAGKNKVSIAANGDMYPCDSFVGNEQYKIGNIYTGAIKEQPFKNLSVKENITCKSCWARFICGGDCYHNSVLVNGSIYEPDNVICELEKHIIYHTLIYLDNMMDICPDQFTYLQNLLNIRESLK